MRDKKGIYEEYRTVLDEKLLSFGFKRSQDMVERGDVTFVSYERDYFLMLWYVPGIFGKVKLEGTGELDLNLLKPKEKNIKAIDKWIAMLDVWPAQNK